RSPTARVACRAAPSGEITGGSPVTRFMPPAAMPGPKPKNITASAATTSPAPPSQRRQRMSAHCLEFVDHPLDHRQAPVPEIRVARVEAERGEQFAVVLTASGLEHLEILVLEAGQASFVG